MNIVFFTETEQAGYFNRNHPNARTDVGWMIALEAYNLPLKYIPKEKKFDLGIVIIPKTDPSRVDVSEYKKACKKVAVMQEGPNWYYQDYSLSDQMKYLENLNQSDFIFAHNEGDTKYYKGLLPNKKVYKLQSLMIEDEIKEDEMCPIDQRSGVMIGGNCSSWYGGIDSYFLAFNYSDEIYAPIMGEKTRFKKEELGLRINHLPYTLWSDWIYQLSKRKLGIHMMKTFAAGTFSLNCSYLGIPCVGYSYLDTQRILHPELSVDYGDLEKASKIVKLLKDDKDFYMNCSEKTKKLYTEHYHEGVFLNKFRKLCYEEVNR